MTLRRILQDVCDANEINIERVVSKTRKRDYVIAREMFSYIACAFGYPDEDIADTINRDRTTVVYYRQEFEAMLDLYDPISVRSKWKYRELMNQYEADSVKIGSGDKIMTRRSVLNSIDAISSILEELKQSLDNAVKVLG